MTLRRASLLGPGLGERGLEPPHREGEALRLRSGPFAEEVSPDGRCGGHVHVRVGVQGHRYALVPQVARHGPHVAPAAIIIVAKMCLRSSKVQ